VVGWVIQWWGLPLCRTALRAAGLPDMYRGAVAALPLRPLLPLRWLPLVASSQAQWLRIGFSGPPLPSLSRNPHVHTPSRCFHKVFMLHTVMPSPYG
jgi:hypothetical protein